MPRPIWSGTISFGLVSIPVKLYNAVSKKSVSFNQLDSRTGSRIRLKKTSAEDGSDVPDDVIVKGYEVSKGQYVVFSPEELKALDEKATNSIDIAEFVPLDKIDRVYLDKAYFLGPDKGGERAYHLLAKALEETGRAALGQYAARGKQNLVLVRPTASGVLVMEQLHYADELKKASEVPIPETSVKDTELKLAKQLIEQTATDEFHPEKYHDQVRDRVLQAIQAKVDGQEITSEPAEKAPTKIIDLMEALKASLAKGGSRDAEAETAKPAKKKARKAS